MRTVRRSPALAAVAVVVVGLVLAGIAITATHGKDSVAPCPAVLPASPSALPGCTYPQFQRLLAGLRGKPVVVNMWASWCGPCIREAPMVAAVARQFAGRVQFVGVDLQDIPGLARAFIARYGIPYPSVSDRGYAIRNGMGFLGQPDTVVFDAAGARVKAWSGPTFTQDELVAQLTAITS